MADSATASIAGPIVTGLVSAGAAMLGAWLGARFAFGRYKSERSFDKRIAWHEETNGLLHRIGGHFDLGATFDTRCEYGAANTEYVSGLQLGGQLELAVLQAELYAGQAAADALHKLTATLNETRLGRLPVDPIADIDAMKARIRSARATRLVCAIAAKALASDVRVELGLKPLRYPHPTGTATTKFPETSISGHTPDTPPDQTAPA